MLKRVIMSIVALSFLVGLMVMSQDALAKRRCPPGTDDDITPNVCVPK